jgi:hypothetical protein
MTFRAHAKYVASVEIGFDIALLDGDPRIADLLSDAKHLVAISMRSELQTLRSFANPLCMYVRRLEAYFGLPTELSYNQRVRLPLQSCSAKLQKVRPRP